MKPRTVKVSDALWAAALAAADRRGEVLSEEIRKFLESYTAEAGEVIGVPVHHGGKMGDS